MVIAAGDAVKLVIWGAVATGGGDGGVGALPPPQAASDPQSAVIRMYRNLRSSLTLLLSSGPICWTATRDQPDHLQRLQTVYDDRFAREYGPSCLRGYSRCFSAFRQTNGPWVKG